MDQVFVCDINAEVRTEIRSFLFQKRASNAALVLKIERAKKEVVVDELFEDIKLEDLQEELPNHQPRYILFNYKMTHADGRISNPIIFIYYTPRDSQPDLQVMYASMKVVIEKEVGSPHAYEVRDTEDLSEDWLHGKLK